MIGRVVSTKTKNTAVVLVERQAMHSLYKKAFLRSKRFLVNDILGVKEGDIVEIEKCKPISRNKHWKTVKILGSSFAEIAEQHLKEKAEELVAEVMPEEKESEQVAVNSEQSEEAKEKPVKNKKSAKTKKGAKE